MFAILSFPGKNAVYSSRGFFTSLSTIDYYSSLSGLDCKITLVCMLTLFQAC